MSLFFSNPELIRNARIQLRPGRMIAAAVISAVISITAWSSIMRTDFNFSIAGLHKAGAMFALTLDLQVAILLIGGGIYCLQSVHREKELNTFDYQRVTRLTSLELAVGKLFGAPIGAYFVVICMMPVALIGAARAHLPATLVLGAYVILLMGSITYHALALLVSVLLSRTGGLVMSILLYLMLVWVSSYDFFADAVPWHSALLYIHTVNPFFAGSLIAQPASVIHSASNGLAAGFYVTDMFVGKPVSHFVVLVVLYVIFTAWFMLGITRNLKRDPSLYEVFSPNQAFAFVLYLNLFLMGFFPWTERFREQDFVIGNKPFHLAPAAPYTVELELLGVSLWLFAILALILLRNRERARAKIRHIGSRSARLLAALWPTPYVIGGIALVGGTIISLVLHLGNRSDGDMELGVYQVAFLAIWLARDALYLQWMNLRRVRRPLAAAVLYLIVFYGSTGVIFGALNLYNNARSAASTGILVPSPLFVLGPSFWSQQMPLWLLALAAQAAEAVVFWLLHWMSLREFEATTSPEGMRTGDLAQPA